MTAARDRALMLFGACLGSRTVLEAVDPATIGKPDADVGRAIADLKAVAAGKLGIEDASEVHRLLSRCQVSRSAGASLVESLRKRIESDRELERRERALFAEKCRLRAPALYQEP